jgi:hypothetical protein
LAQLIDAELIFRRGTPPDAEYTFKHALVQDAAYSTLLRSRRQQLHGRIAATLETHFSEFIQTQPHVLARHCAEAGLVEKAVGYWLKAGQLAMARSAMTEAVARLHKGLDLLSGLADGPWRWQQELDPQIALRSALTATKGLAASEVGETIARACALAEQVNRPEYLVPLLYGQCVFHFFRSEYRVALSLAERIEKIGDVTMQLQGRRFIATIRCYLGEFVAARDGLEQCHGLADHAHRQAVYDPYPVMLIILAVTLAHLGYIDQARSRMNEALLEARQQPQTLSIVLSGATWMDAIIRSPELQRRAEELLVLSTEHGFPQHLGWPTIYLGMSFTLRQQAQEGLALLMQGLEAVRATGNIANTPYLFMWLAEADRVLGQPVQGLNWLAQAAHTIETTEERIEEAEMHRLQGDLLYATGDQVSAARSYDEDSLWPGGRAPKYFNYALESASPSSGAIKARARKLAIFFRRSTAGSPRGSIRLI